MAEHDCVLLLFAKAPVAGAVKTRLCPPLSGEQAAELHRRLLWHTLEAVSRAGLGPIVLYCAPDICDPFFGKCAEHFSLQMTAQVSGDLGVKMPAALKDGLAMANRALLIGSDCPSITPAYLRSAANALVCDAKVVLGPAEDGGYGLVGVTGGVPDIFTDIPWGTSLVMNETLGRLRASSCRWRELPPIWDVDTAADLARLAIDPRLSHLSKGLTADRIAV